MSLRTRVFKGALALAAGRALGDLCSFARNIIVARLLTPADVGLGATFWITVALLQMISDLASDRLLIQAPDGDEPQFQDTLHLWEFGRGLLNSLLLFALAWPVAYLFKAPQALWAFQSVALVPLLRGLCHLDVRRFHRHLRYGPGVNIELVAQIGALALAYPLCRWRGDYAAVLVLVLLHELIRTIGSYVAAERRYRWAWSGPHVRRLLTFGWPLLANGLLLFAIMKGDRLIVGAGYSTYDLGLYAMAFALASAPFSLIAGVLNPLALPLLAAVQDQPADLERRVQLCTAVFALAAGVVGIPLVVFAPWLLERLYGAPYAAAAGVLVWLVTARMVWFVRVAPTLTAMARADTRNALLANVFRLTGVGLAVLAAGLGLALEAVAAAALIGEVVAALAAVALVRWRHHIPLRLSLVPTAALLPVFAAVLSLREVFGPDRPDVMLAASGALGLLLAGLMLTLVPPLRLEFARAVASLRRRALRRTPAVRRTVQQS